MEGGEVPLLTIYTYKNSRPSDEQVLQLLAGEENYTYLTATKALARERYNLIPPTQHFLNRRGKKVRKALFSEVLQGWIKDKFPVVSRGEEKVILLRAIDDIAKTDPVLAGMLRQDRESWLRVFADLSARKVDLSHGLPPEWQARIVNPSLIPTLLRLKTAVKGHLQQNGMHTFEEAFYLFIEQYYEPSPLIIMEGFTYLTELQKAFIDSANAKGAKIIFLVPYFAEQRVGFKIIEETYKVFGSALEKKEIETEPISPYEDIHYLQKSLLANTPSAPPSRIEHIHLVGYPNRDREIKGCLEQVQQWFSTGKYTPEDVAIVMRRPREFMELIQDYLNMTPLNYVVRDPMGNEKRYPVEIAASPRLLLLTPIGRFVLLLYSIWEDGQLKLDMESFETILASGWLGATLQDTAINFRAVKHQFFAQCTTREEWHEAFRNARSAREVLSQKERLPIHLLDSDIINQWEKTLKVLNNVCFRLFSQGMGTIGEHIAILLRELDFLLPEDIRRAEKAVLEKIKEVFLELSTIYSIDLTTQEFGEALNALTRAEMEEDEDSEEEFAGEKNRKNLLITTPEAIDGIVKKCVIYLGTDNQRVPGLYSEPWPFFSDQKYEHIIKERYMFLTVLRSAKEHLVLSYAYKDEDRSFQPSTYLTSVEEILQFPIEKKTVTDSLDLSRAYVQREQLTPSPVRRKTYNLEELAHYGLCPMRYRLEILHPEARIYRNSWQLEISAQGIWLDQIYRTLLDEELPRNLVRRWERMNQVKEQVGEEVKRLFPSFTQVNWHSIHHHVESTLRYHCEHKGTFTLKITSGREAHVRLFTEDESIVTVRIHTPYQKKIGLFERPLLDTLLCSEWLLPVDGSVKKDDVPEEDENRFSNLGEAVHWWRETIKAFFADLEGRKENDKIRAFREQREDAETRLLKWITAIEQNVFPKNPGNHCNKCPVHMECLGRTMEVIS